LLKTLERRKRLRDYAAALTLKLTVDSNGRVSEISMIESTGQRDLDQLIVDAIRNDSRCDTPPPPDLPQPMPLRLGSRKPTSTFDGSVP